MSSLPPDFFSAIARELAARTARATVSQVGPASSALLAHLQHRLERGVGEPGGFLSEPVFEAMFSWPTHASTMEALSKVDPTGRRLLHPDLVGAMDEPSRPELISQRFQRTWHPYVHQVKAWEALLSEPARSVVVSTGTGSGKTECFLVPILDDLVRQASTAHAPLRGVQALFLYPLNALINSQRDRLRAWTSKFAGKVRFGLYNGVTPNTVPEAEQRRAPEEVLSRKLLRADPPPILVTNNVMLEFMLVRAQDAGILAQSQGKLRWIVLDEAHTYVGSQAAEISLLLRRVLHAFGVQAEDVRFVATSATIGDGKEAREQLASYMASLAGVDPKQVVVVDGKRHVPELEEVYRNAQGASPDLGQLRESRPADLFDALARVPQVRRVRDVLAKGPATLTTVVTELANAGGASSATVGAPESLALLDIATRAIRKVGDETEPLLPVRAHFFLRTQSGLWACSDPRCPQRGEDLSTPAWGFGAVYFERRETCDCGSRVFEIVICQGCGAEHLSAVQVDDRIEARAIDGWLGAEADAEEDEELPDDETEPAAGAVAKRRLVQGASTSSSSTVDEDDVTEIQFDPKTGTTHGGPATFRMTLPEDERLRCHRCGQRETAELDLFRPIRLGAPFYLSVAIPALLEQLPAAEASEGVEPRPLPFEGRRLITFTDSRQGTARFAIKSQLESERNYLRSYVYHTLWAGSAAPPAEVERLRGRIERLKTAGLADDAAEFQSELNALLEGKPVPWLDLRVRLEQQATIHTWMKESQRMRYLAATLSASQIAKMFLLREFARRPKRMNSLETLGLAAVRYPLVHRITEAPLAWRRRGLALADWQDFLKLCLDFVVRSYTAISIEQDILRWMGTRIAPKRIAAPGSRQVKNRIYAWPSVAPGRPLGRMAKLLVRALKLDDQSDQDRGDVDVLLKTAWEQLRPYLRADDDGFVFDFEDKTVIAKVRSAWVCPVTRRILDTTLLGVSPYQTDRWAAGTATCVRVDMPTLPVQFAKSAEDKETLRTWLERDGAVHALRARGVWTEFSDRIASGTTYLEVGEHSAQQRPARLRELEKLFKEGRVNVLSCSTTMEMGVDIGGISAVAMNNAPPGPANFFQRAGRAGRRGETAAASLTLCQSAPHGEAVFRDPLWPFKAPIHVPSVSLTSDRIVMRHVGSLALAAFLATRTTDALRLKCSWFFERAEGTNASPAEQFSNWLVETAPEDPKLTDGLRRLVRGSNLAMTEPRVLLADTAARLQPVAEDWLEELQVLLAALKEVGGDGEADGQRSPEQTSVLLALRRARGEYLLKALASGGFLPAYGFPIDVVAFDPTTAEELRAIRIAREDDQESESREDSLGWKNSLPSRDLAMAIRDYAPGSGVVINGMVYESGGITLNWQLPPNQESGEPQIVRWAFTCSACGARGTAPTMPEVCRRCSSPTIRKFKYLRPAGFAVDIFSRPHNDVSQQRFVPAQDPWITAANAPWEPLPQPEVGRYRYDPDGMLFHRNAGVAHNGYAVCLRCGRAASETGPASETEVPKELETHRPLRGGRKKGDDLCPGGGSGFTIQRNVRLGGEQTTDVFELQLSDPLTGAPLNDLTTAMTLAVALREAVARRLGVEAREIGWSAFVDRSEVGDGRATIVLYDTAGGGAGYVGQVAPHLAALLHDARVVLSCPRNCDRACHGCLLRFDTQHDIEQLDRHAAHAYLSDTLLDALAPPPAHSLFGDGSRPAFQRTFAGVVRELGRTSATEVRVYLGGDAVEWDRPTWALGRALVSFLSMPGRIARVFLPNAAISSMTWSQANDWADWAHGTGVELRGIDAPPRAGVGYLACEVLHASETELFGVFHENSLIAGEDWGTGAPDERSIRATLPERTALKGTLLAPAALRRPAPSDRTLIELRSELNVPVGAVGRRFFEVVAARFHPLKELLAAKAALDSIEYRDRYVRSPLTARILYELVRSLREDFGLASDATSLKIRVAAPQPSNRPAPTSLKHDWRDDRDHKDVLESIARRVAPDASVLICPDARDMPHDRELRLRWPDSKMITISLDQGIGFLEPAAFYAHRFDRAPTEQVRSIISAGFLLRATSSFPTKIHVGFREDRHAPRTPTDGPLT